MAIAKIICATDFSKLSVRAAHVGAELAAAHGASLVVLYVDPPPEFSGLGPDFAALVEADLAEFHRSQDRFVDTNLRVLAGELRSHHDIEVETELIHGRAADGIVEFVERADADLLVIGHHGAGAHRLLLGSVAARVARQVNVPTLVVPADTDPDAAIGSRVLVAVDLIDKSSLAVTRAALALCRPGAKLELFHAFYEPMLASLGESAGLTTDLTQLFDTARRCSVEHLERLAANIESKNVEVRYELERGSPARRVLARAEVFDADLIAVGTHRRTGVERLIGTTAERILRGAEVPVLLVPIQ
jgi:nucleotide-binding universal stress UspA family protein